MFRKPPGRFPGMRARAASLVVARPPSSSSCDGEAAMTSYKRFLHQWTGRAKMWGFPDMFPDMATKSPMPPNNNSSVVRKLSGNTITPVRAYVCVYIYIYTHTYMYILEKPPLLTHLADRRIPTRASKPSIYQHYYYYYYY